MPEGSAGQPSAAGRIVTFYSFKGGTGRTMALANVAWILAANGKRVLAADWDLESPGLHRFFQPFMNPGVSGKPGIVDFIRQYEWRAKDQATRIEATDLSREDKVRTVREAVAGLTSDLVAHVGRYTVPVDWQFPGNGAIDFLTPGRQGDGVYANALSALDWDTLYDDLGGAGFFDALRTELKNSYDYVLIDSRTGLSDIADICTLHLPDMVVDCFTLSTQGMEGAARIAGQIRRYSERDITILPVLMRIDHTQRANVLAGLRLAQSLFPGLPADMSQQERDEYWAEVQVPYLPPYAYEETLAAFGDRPGDRDSLLPAYERIVARITDNDVTALPPREEWKRLRTRLLFARTVPRDQPEIVIQYSPRTSCGPSGSPRCWPGPESTPGWRMRSPHAWPTPGRRSGSSPWRRSSTSPTLSCGTVSCATWLLGRGLSSSSVLRTCAFPHQAFPTRCPSSSWPTTQKPRRRSC